MCNMGKTLKFMSWRKDWKMIMKTRVRSCLFATLLLTCLSSAQSRLIDVTVDARVELLAVVQYLSDYGDRTGRIIRQDFP